MTSAECKSFHPVATGPQSKSLYSQVQSFVGLDKALLLSLSQPALITSESDYLCVVNCMVESVTAPGGRLVPAPEQASKGHTQLTLTNTILQTVHPLNSKI